MNTVKLLAVFAENKPGQTARITKILTDANINIRWATVASIGAFGVMKLLVNDSHVAYQALKHEGYVATLIEVLAVEVPDKPGSLHAVVNCLAQNGINLDNTSGFVANNRAILIIEVRELDAARAALQAEGLRALTQEEMLNL
jgi:hypothetical protein